MAKQNCKHCGKEIGFVSQVKLADGSFICRDCYKQAGRVFNNMVHTYPAYERLLKEQERNERIVTSILKGQKKSEVFGDESGWFLYCYAASGLMFFKTERGGFAGLGGDKTYNIYRYADLASYEEADGNQAIDARTKPDKKYVHLVFDGDYAVSDIYMPSKPGMTKKLANYFDECFGLGGKGFRGFRNSIKKNKQDIMAAAAITQGIKSMLSGGDQEQAAQVITDQAKLVLQGDRSDWIRKTNEVLASAGINWEV